MTIRQGVQRQWTQWLGGTAQAVLVLALGWVLARALTGDGWERMVALVTQTFVMVSALVNPLVGLLLGLILAPFAPFWHFDLSMGAGVPDLGLVRMTVLVVGFLVLAQLARGTLDLPSLGWTEVGMLIFVGGMLVATRMALKGFVFALQTAFDAYVVPFAFYLLARVLVNRRERLRLTLNVLLFVAVYVAVLVLHESWTGVSIFYPWGRAGLYGGSLRRVTNLFGNPVYHAMILNVLLPVAIYRYVTATDTTARRGYLALVLLMLTAVAFLYSRAGYLAAFLVMTLMAVRYPRWRRLYVPALVAGLVVLALFWGRFTQSQLYQDRLLNVKSVESRGKTVDVAIRLWKENPLFGIGYPNYGLITLQRGYFVQIDDKWLPAPHNTFFGILSQAGALAFTGYVLMILGVFRELMSRYRQGVRSRVRALALPEEPTDASEWAYVGFTALVAYLTIIATIDADPAQFSNIVFYTLLGAILGYLSRWVRLHSPREREGAG